MESESFRENDDLLRKEIRRVEGNTETNKIKLRKLQDSYEIEIREEFSGDEEIIRRDRDIKTGRHRKVEERFRTLQNEHFRRRAELKELRNGYEPPIAEEIRRNIDKINRIRNSWQNSGRITKTGNEIIKQYADEEERINEQFNNDRRKAIQRFGRYEEKFRQGIYLKVNEIDGLTKKISADINTLESRRIEIGINFERTRREIRENFERRKEEIIDFGRRINIEITK